MGKMTVMNLKSRRGVPRTLLIGAVAGAILAGPSAWARPAPESFADLAEQVTPAVVNISIERDLAQAEGSAPQAERGLPDLDDPSVREFFERFFGRDWAERMPGQPRPDHRGRTQALGSGFIVDAEGFVVTNNHVIDEASQITVTMTDGRSLEAELIGGDKRTDLALLKVEAEAPLPFVKMGDSDAVRVGDWVMAVGNPFGLGGTVTAGIVSARGRDLQGGSLIDFLQIDASINRGNSGGPAFNGEGQVIGVNTAIFSPNGGSVGIGFAIPSNEARQVIAQLRDHGRVERGWLGVRIQPVTPELAEGLDLDEPRGALVASVQADSPAVAAGLEAGDVVLAWDGQEVEEFKDLSRLVAATAAGETVQVALWRKGAERSVSVVTGSPPEEASVAALDDEHRPEKDGLQRPAGTGLTLSDLSPEHRERFRLDEALEGALIVEVDSSSGAAELGLRPGDVILSVAQETVASAADAAEAIDEARADGRKVVTLLASRQGTTSFFALRLEQA
jgi:serine protease Do